MAGLVALGGCQSSSPPTTSTTATQTAAQRPKHDVLVPPVQRLAWPLEVLAMRLPDGHVGELRSKDLPGGETIPLKAIAVNLCQTGWFVQGLVEQDGKLQTSAGFLLEFAQIPNHKFIYEVPDVTKSHLVVDLQQLSLEKAKGSLTVIDVASQQSTFSMSFDGIPVGVPAQPGFSAQGCFTTGYFRLPDGVQGPATAVFDGDDLFYVGMRLSEQHSLVVMLSMRADLRKPQNVIQGSLEHVAIDPQKFPFRVLLEKRTNSGEIGEKSGPLIQTEQIPIQKGTIRAAFLSTDPKGPLRIDLRDLELPTWDGPLSGAKLDRVQAEVLFVNDPKSPVIPVPSEPNWKSSEL